jgi:transcriptional regulator with XRE-family HTH domain/Zn-dependent peptidase ImmA (M78 family)
MTTDLDFIGKNIRYLRRRRGWTMAELAAKIGIREGPLGKIERGANAPSAAVIYQTAKVFGVSVDAIFSEGDQKPPCRQHEDGRDPFQVSIDDTLPELPKKTYLMANELFAAVQALEDICHAQKRAAVPLYIPFDPTEAGMEALSDTVRHIMEIKHGVLFDYLELFENMGLRVIVAPLPKELDSFTFYDPPNQNAFFFLNAKNNPERQLFQLTSELGSVFICTYTRQQGHHLFAEENPGETPDNKPFTARRATRRFSATFLMPAQAVRDTVAQLGIQQKRWSYELLLRIKHRFGISAEAFLYRLNELHLIDPDLVEPLKKNIESYYKKSNFSEPDFSRRLLTPNGRLWDLVLTAKQFEDDLEEVVEIETTLNKWKVIRK